MPSMPSTVPFWSSATRSDASPPQRTMSLSFVAGLPQYASLRARLISVPRSHDSSRYGPVPLTWLTIGWSPPPVADTCVRSQPESLIPNAGEAILVRNATSGAHRSNTTVEASLATMRLRLPR